MLIGQRIILRPIKVSNAPNFFEWINDPEIIENLSINPTSNVEAERRWIQIHLDKKSVADIIWAVDLLANNAPIGICGLHKIDHVKKQTEITVIIGEEIHRNKGYGVEISVLMINYAFKNLGLKRVYTGAFDFNQRSVKYLLKVGFLVEGKRKKAKLKNGVYHDEILFGLSNPELK